MGERGWALVSVLWVVMGLTLLAAGTEALTTTLYSLERRSLTKATVDAALDAGIVRAALGIEAPDIADRWRVDGVPQQFPLLDLLIEDEGTEFHFARVTDIPAQVSLPYVSQVPGAGWVGIFESRLPGFPSASLVRAGANIMLTHLPDQAGDPGVAFVGVTPWTGPWRILVIGPDREKLAQTGPVRALEK